MISSPILIVLCGPTAIGKTATSIAIAKQLKAPVISADSRQFFKEMSIGTAKPNREEMADVKHYFIDSHSVSEEYNVVNYEKDVIELVEQLFKKHPFVLLVGGSGLYIDAVCKGFDDIPSTPSEIRNEVTKAYQEKGIEGLRKQLQQLDPEYYQQVDLSNPQRIGRAVEVCLSTGKPYSSFRKGNTTQRNFRIIKIGLNTSRELLYDRINKRVDKMIADGLLDEVEGLVKYKHLNALQTVGYKELFDYLDKKTDLDTAITSIKQNTRRFAKRQLTWFRKDEDIKWFEPNQEVEILNVIKNLS